MDKGVCTTRGTFEKLRDLHEESTYVAQYGIWRAQGKRSSLPRKMVRMEALRLPGRMSYTKRERESKKAHYIGKMERHERERQCAEYDSAFLVRESCTAMRSSSVRTELTVRVDEDQELENSGQSRLSCVRKLAREGGGI